MKTYVFTNRIMEIKHRYPVNTIFITKGEDLDCEITEKDSIILDGCFRCRFKDGHLQGFDLTTICRSISKRVDEEG